MDINGYSIETDSQALCMVMREIQLFNYGSILNLLLKCY